MQAGHVILSDATFLEVGAGQPPSFLDGREPFAVDTVSSHGMLVRASTWDAVGGLEEDYFPLYMADLTISRQVWSRGEAVLCAPDARSEHTRHASTNRRFRTFLFERHFAQWRARWAADIARFEPPGGADEAAIERGLSRVGALWRQARPGPKPATAPTPPYDPDGDERQRLTAGIRFASLALETRERFSDELEQSLDAMEADLVAERERLEHERARPAAYIARLEAELETWCEHEPVTPGELAQLRRSSETLSAIEAGGWRRLRRRLLPLLSLAGRLRSPRP